MDGCGEGAAVGDGSSNDVSDGCNDGGGKYDEDVAVVAAADGGDDGETRRE
jgi:hypothetical protein